MINDVEHLFMHLLAIFLSSFMDYRLILLKATGMYRNYVTCLRSHKQEVTELGSRSVSRARAVFSLLNSGRACHWPEKNKAFMGKCVCAKRYAWSIAPIRILPLPKLSSWMSVSVSSVCHHRIPQTEGLKQQKYISSQFRGLEVQDQGAIRVGFCCCLSSWLVDSCLLTVSSQGLSTVHVKRQKERSPTSLPLLRGTPVLSD